MVWWNSTFLSFSLSPPPSPSFLLPPLPFFLPFSLPSLPLQPSLSILLLVHSVKTFFVTPSPPSSSLTPPRRGHMTRGARSPPPTYSSTSWILQRRPTPVSWLATVTWSLSTQLPDHQTQVELSACYTMLCRVTHLMFYVMHYTISYCFILVLCSIVSV